MGKCISFHSYKGGTGKTTLAANFSFQLASQGYKVYLLDLDFYAPSFYSYFEVTPKYWINDYLKNESKADDIMIRMNDKLKTSLDGELFVAFSRGGKEDIYQLEGSLQNDREQQLNQFRNFIALREDLLVNNDADYIIMDTSPGIRYWSINSIVISDIVLLTLKMGDIDLKGTLKMIDELYGSLIEYGSICKLLLNRVSGYCVPFNLDDSHKKIDLNNESEFKKKIQRSLKPLSNKSFNVDIMGEIPCYCDIQFKEKEFLTVKEYPQHPFSYKIAQLSSHLAAL